MNLTEKLEKYNKALKISGEDAKAYLGRWTEALSDLQETIINLWLAEPIEKGLIQYERQLFRENDSFGPYTSYGLLLTLPGDVLILLEPRFPISFEDFGVLHLSRLGYPSKVKLVNRMADQGKGVSWTIQDVGLDAPKTPLTQDSFNALVESWLR